ncbi:HPr-rel-A system PqqD family peptide chaperone [Kineobactrum salinum]|uniref:HPr-rel-A system PqqD family peptide chaperone n=1 Tax=Kineobactrum salinum TaxID=2708301 RepID=A0A6C0TY58_9GAMM|nr:HPr-rel-A system PqqD family peptide chaperone [Kineobactrum salinum]QIB64731.1 HPr-rel-A system PqqD family peptide chaperone [Kineobactrum salinum]
MRHFTAAPGLIIRELDGVKVVYDGRSGDTHFIAGAGAVLMDELGGGAMAEADIARHWSTVQGAAGSDTLPAELEEFLTGAVEAGILRAR